MQLWKGVFAGITSLEGKALLLRRMKVGGQGTLLRTCCYAVLGHSSTQPSQPNQKYNFFQQQKIAKLLVARGPPKLGQNQKSHSDTQTANAVAMGDDLFFN